MIQSLVATLISARQNPVLDAPMLAQARAALPASHDTAVLAAGIAVDLHFESEEAPADLEARLRLALGSAPVDVVVQAPHGRRKRLFLADMDSTMIEQECIDELADLVGLKAHVSAITERAMRGEIAFEPALRERVALLKGLPVSVIDEVVRTRLTLMPGGRELLRTMRAFGTHTALVSGGFTMFTQRIADLLGFHENHANQLETADGHLTGRVIEPILGREAKRATLLSLRAHLALDPAQTLAVGDGANDLAMLGEAGLGVAYRAKPAVAAAARMRVDHADLTALLFAQGYALTDFAGL